MDKTNIEEIINNLKDKTTLEMRKLNGIEFECTIPKDSTYTKCKTEINKLCKAEKYTPVSFQQSTTEDCFKVEFPELEPYYTEEQNLSLYTDSINWLIQNCIQAVKFNNYAYQTGKIPTKTEVTKQTLLDSDYIYVKEAITIYYKSNMNPYKAKLEDVLSNSEYVQEIQKLFNKIVNNYQL